MTRAQVEEFMFDMLTNPDTPIVKRMGAAAFFLRRVDKMNRLVLITPNELITACQIILTEASKDEKNAVTKNFWTTVVSIIDFSSEYIQPADVELPTLEEVEHIYSNIVSNLLTIPQDPGADALMYYYPGLSTVLIDLIEMTRRIDNGRIFYGEFLR